MNPLPKKLKVLAVLSTLAMLILLLGGALVTKTESGEGCGTSWPLCHGKIIPDEITLELVIEFSHRIVTGIVTILVVLFVVTCKKYIGHIRETRFLSFLAIGFIIIQSLIGAANVIWGQSAFFLAIHFGISLISFASVFLLALLVFELDKKINVESLIIDNRMKAHTIGVIIYCYFVIYTGALVRHMEAGLICNNWPFCHNYGFSWPQNIYEWVQMGHRAAAGFIFLWILYIYFLVRKFYKDEPILYYGWTIAFTLAFLQIISGALVVFTGLNLFISLLHALFITTLFGLLSYFLFIISRSNDQMNKNIHLKKTSAKKIM